MFDQWLKIEFDSGAQPEATIVCAISRRWRPYIFFFTFRKKKIGRPPWSRSRPVGSQKFGEQEQEQGDLWFPNPKIQVRKSKFSEKSFVNAIKYSILSTKLKISRLYSFRTLSLILLSLFRLRNTKDESVSRWTCLLSLYCCQNGHFCLGVRVGESWNRAPEYCWLGDSDRKYERREGMIVRGLFF